jgi:ubiquinone/menaquinone biosynthesis C-methylase UbiE
VSAYGSLFARIYDPFLAWGERAGMRDLRRRVLAAAHGRVLEIGAGTGLNLPLYPDGVTSLTLAEPDPAMAAKLRGGRAAQGRGAEVVQAPAEDLPFADSSFDTVVSTLVLCTVDDQPAALAEIRRVLEPGGTLLFLEHVRADGGALERWQDRLHGPWHAFGYGCHCNRDTEAGIAVAGFTIDRLEHERWRRMPRIVAPLIVGAARPA